MTQIPGAPVERRNVHGSRGEHLFPHPETYARKSDWTSWDRAYARHLDRHRELIENPEPQAGDSEVIISLFEHIAHLEQIVEKEKLLIRALRQRAAASPEQDDQDVANTLKQRGVGS